MSKWVSRRQVPGPSTLLGGGGSGEPKIRTRGGTNQKHQREKEVRRQRTREERRREEVAVSYSPASSSSRTADETTPAERLRLVVGMVRPVLPCGGVALSATLTYEDALVDGGAKRIEHWTYKRVMEKSFSGGRSIVAYHTLPFMRADRRPVGWDKWGRPWP